MIFLLYTWRFGLSYTEAVTSAVCLSFLEPLHASIEPLPQVDPEPLDQITEAKAQKWILCSCIAMGLFQLLALCNGNERKHKIFRFLRTPSKGACSEATMMAHLRQMIFQRFARNRHLTLTQIIQEKQETPEIQDDLLIFLAV
ncbi:hypothetical protein [Sporolactobacillus pectinivorans]|uniref:hypothetical protein n=1 Tax=Sporolactobacillus pectinivorans TaxID=1591408 RepID=UPI000C25C70B|nr:hypothetical protein [Sporolactobacillus pectinivorans]